MGRGGEGGWGERKRGKREKKREKKKKTSVHHAQAFDQQAMSRIRDFST